MPTKKWMEENPEKCELWKKKCSENMRKRIKKNPHFQDGEKNPMFGKLAWNRGLTKDTDSRIKKYAETRKQKIKEGKIIPVWKGKKHSELHKKRNSLAKLGDKNPMKNKDVRLKVSKIMKEKWKDDQYANKVLQSCKNLKLNNLEKQFIDLFKKYKLPFEYVGDGSFWIGPCKSGKRRNPDFKHIVQRKVILINGNHWHTDDEIIEQVRDYNDKGFEVLSIWEKNWRTNKKAILNKLKNFAEYYYSGNSQPVF